MIVITGATGLLGSIIAQKLKDFNYPLRGLRRANSTLPKHLEAIEWYEADLTDIASLEKSFEGADLVIHAGALVSFDPRDKHKLYQINVEGTSNVVNSCLNVGVPRLIHISSVAALGRQKGVTTVDENSKWVDSNLNSDYAESKYFAELEVFRGREEGLQIDIINPSIILSRSDWSKSSSQLFRYVWKQTPFYTDGVVNYVDARDVAETVFKIIGRTATGERFIASAGSIPVKELLQKIATHLNKKAPSIRVPEPLISVAAVLEYLRSRLTGSEPIVSVQSARSANEKFIYNNYRTKTELGITFTDLEETLKWCCSYYIEKGTTNN